MFAVDQLRYVNMLRLKVGGVVRQTGSSYHRRGDVDGAPIMGIYLHQTQADSETLTVEATHEAAGSLVGRPRVSDGYVQVLQLPASAEWVHADNGATDSLTSALKSVNTPEDTPLSSTFRADAAGGLTVDTDADKVVNGSGRGLPVLAVGWARWDRDASTSEVSKAPCGSFTVDGARVPYGLSGAYCRGGRQGEQGTWQAAYCSAAVTDLGSGVGLGFHHFDVVSSTNAGMGVYASGERHMLGLQVLNLETLDPEVHGECRGESERRSVANNLCADRFGAASGAAASLRQAHITSGGSGSWHECEACLAVRAERGERSLLPDG